MNIPNILTMARVAVIPVFIVILMVWRSEVWAWYVAAGIFLAASATDALDGYIARKKNLVTDFGKLMDPLADKILVVSALICLTELGVIPGWMVIVILAREFTITGLRSVAASSGTVIAAGFSGKLKTVSQMTAITLILLRNFPFSLIPIPMDQIVLWISVLLTLYSGIEYMVQNRQVFSMKQKDSSK